MLERPWQRVAAAVAGPLALTTLAAARRSYGPAAVYAATALVFGWVATPSGTNTMVDCMIRWGYRRRGWGYDEAGVKARSPQITHTLAEVRAELAHRVFADLPGDPELADVVHETAMKLWEHTGAQIAEDVDGWGGLSDWQRGLRRYYALTGVANAVIGEMTDRDSILVRQRFGGHTFAAIELAAICQLADNKTMMMV